MPPRINLSEQPAPLLPNATWISVGSTIVANANMTAIIPDDHYYRLQSGATFNGWSELR